MCVCVSIRVYIAHNVFAWRSNPPGKMGLTLAFCTSAEFGIAATDAASNSSGKRCSFRRRTHFRNACVVFIEIRYVLGTSTHKHGAHTNRLLFDGYTTLHAGSDRSVSILSATQRPIAIAFVRMHACVYMFVCTRTRLTGWIN